MSLLPSADSVPSFAICADLSLRDRAVFAAALLCAAVDRIPSSENESGWITSCLFGMAGVCLADSNGRAAADLTVPLSCPRD